MLPERDQKRSGRENRIILESATETCSKHDFSMICVGYSSRIFCDFDGFPQISQFLHTVLTASWRRIASKGVHFRGFGWIRAIFWSKSTKFRHLGQSVTGTWPKAFRAWKSHYFGKCHRDVLKTWFFVDFCRVHIEDFRRFSRIFTDFNVFAYGSDRFQEANCFQMRLFSCFFPYEFYAFVTEIYAKLKNGPKSIFWKC